MAVVVVVASQSPQSSRARGPPLDTCHTRTREHPEAGSFERRARRSTPARTRAPHTSAVDARDAGDVERDEIVDDDARAGDEDDAGERAGAGRARHGTRARGDAGTGTGARGDAGRGGRGRRRADGDDRWDARERARMARDGGERERERGRGDAAGRESASGERVDGGVGTRKRGLRRGIDSGVTGVRARSQAAGNVHREHVYERFAPLGVGGVG